LKGDLGTWDRSRGARGEKKKKGGERGRDQPTTQLLSLNPLKEEENVNESRNDK